MSTNSTLDVKPVADVKLPDVSVKPMSIADAMIDGSNFTDQKFGDWGNRQSACALGTSYIMMQQHGYVP